MKQRILVVDDSAFIRRILSDWFRAEPDMEVVGLAADGDQAVSMAKSLRPDVITLDVEMPRKDGLAALADIMKECPTAVVMVSSVTTAGAEATIKALELGAIEIVAKPEGSNSLKFISARDEIIRRVRGVRNARVPKPAPQVKPRVVTARPSADFVRSSSDKVVVIASSTGGPRALATLWQNLPKGFPAPILMVQHMPEGFTEAFAKRLNSVGTVPCREAAEGDKMIPGSALLAPAGRHMTVRPDGLIVFSNDPPMHGVRPAADLLFMSAQKAFGSRCLGVVLTGMGRDGAEGANAIRKCGGMVLGESESTCVVYGMPRAAKEAGGIDSEHAINDMGSALMSALSGRLARAS